MANTYHQVYLHCIFAVKYREARIPKEIRATVCGVIGNLINSAQCKTLIVNGMDDHLHCFLELSPVISIADLMKTVKAKSSKFVNDHQLTPKRFEWQEGYGVFSYSNSQINQVYRYITQQEMHHTKRSFVEEYLEFLRKFDISYDERYVFKDLI